MYEEMPAPSVAETEGIGAEFLKQTDVILHEAVASGRIDADREHVLHEEAKRLSELIGPDNDVTEWAHRFAQATMTESGRVDDEPE
ncbi:MAG: hypothetical protein WCL23_02415 [Candidatus Moraniibacteriota bacterium]